MQIPKEEIKNNILKVARDEFLKNGFEKASVRVITANAKTSKSNVYNYFKDKDALFCAVVEPTILEIQEGLKQLQSRNRYANTYDIGAQKDVIYNFVNFAFGHSEDIKLLFSYSSGSSLQGYKNYLIDSVADVLENWVRQIAPGKSLSKLFLRSVAGFYIGVIEQLIMEGKAKEQAAGHFDEFLKFIYGGWKSTLEQK